MIDLLMKNPRARFRFNPIGILEKKGRKYDEKVIIIVTQKWMHSQNIHFG